MKVKYVEKLMISGISATTNKQNELNEETAKVPALWQEYEDNNIYGKTLNKASDSSFYVFYNNYTDADNGDFDVTLGVEVTKPKKSVSIESKRYLVFTKQGELPDIVMEAWQDVWEYFDGNPEYERTFQTDFEKYFKEDEVEIYISIK